MVKKTSGKKLPIIGITLGDPNGIGPEIILKTFSDSRMLEICTPVIFAQSRLFTFYSRDLNITVKWQGLKKGAAPISGKVNLVQAFDQKFMVEWGKPSKEAGEISIQSFKSAVDHLKENYIDVLVTSPIHKDNIQSEEFSFPGHTDYLNQELDGEAIMFMVSDQLRVGLLTDHVPVQQVSQKITPKLIKQKIGGIKESLKKDFRIAQPKIAVLGINPHAGDNGVIGDEEISTLVPALEELRSDGTLIYGPYAADGFFGNKSHLQFDAVIASYHDQGLIPFKTLSFGYGVNYTAGLSHIRTSPDHGTGYDIAGKGTASTTSFIAALSTAINIHRNRMEYDQLSENSLKISSRKR